MTPEEQYRAEVEQIHAAHRATIAALHKEYDGVRVVTAAGTTGTKPGFIPAQKNAEKAHAFALVRAAIRRNDALKTLEQKG